MYSYGLYEYGIYEYGLHSYGLHSHGLYSYGRSSCGLCSYDLLVCSYGLYGYDIAVYSASTDFKICILACTQLCSRMHTPLLLYSYALANNACMHLIYEIHSALVMQKRKQHAASTGQGGIDL